MARRRGIIGGMTRFGLFPAPALTIAVLFAFGCTPQEEEKPVIQGEFTSSSDTRDTDGVEPPKPPASFPFDEAVKAAGEEIANLPVIEMEIKGKGKVTLAIAEKLAPKTAGQIMRLTEEGFFSGQAIHRVEDFVVQWGDPDSKEYEKNKGRLGGGGSGSPLPFEDNDIAQYRGTLAMARSASEPNGDSQIYILKQDARMLDRQYVAFGFVIDGMDVVDKAEMGDKIEMRVIKK